MGFDAIVKNGLWFDGTGAAARLRHLGIVGGRLAVASESPLEEGGCPTVEPAALLGFADSGAHIRKSSFDSFPLRMLRVGDRADLVIVAPDALVSWLTAASASARR